MSVWMCAGTSMRVRLPAFSTVVVRGLTSRRVTQRVELLSLHHSDVGECLAKLAEGLLFFW